MELSVLVLEEEEGRRAVDVLSSRLHVSKTLAKRIRLYGELLLNGSRCRMIDPVHAGDRLVARLEGEPSASPFQDDGSESPLATLSDRMGAYLADGGRIFLRDPHLCVLEKPARWLTHPTHADRLAISTLVAAFSGQDRVHPVNRLDRGTTGLMVIALDPFSHNHLARQAREGVSVREYTGIVHGVPSPAEGRIEAPIGVDPEHKSRRAVIFQGKDAATQYSLVSSASVPFMASGASSVLSVVRFRLETGRTHQIRVHVAWAGFPLVGDPVYGRGGILDGCISRQALHCSAMTFQHPVDGSVLRFQSPIPSDMVRLIGVPDENA